jgi:CBS domain-containing protein
MRVAELMVRNPTLIAAEESVQSAARAMADIDSRFILVGANDRVTGMLTRGDILIRVVAAGLDPGTTPVSQVMSSSLFTCGEQETAAAVAQRMNEHRIEQMPVLGSDERLVGVITRDTAVISSPADQPQ